MLLLPMILFSSKALTKKEFEFVLICFLIGTINNTLWSILYTHVLHHTEGVRKASRFMSHIRLGLYLNMAIAVCFYFFVRQHSFLRRVLLLLLATYFLFAIYALGLASGSFNFVLLVLLTLCYFIYHQGISLKIIYTLLLLFFLGSIFFYVSRVRSEQIEIKAGVNNTKQEKTPWGSSYISFGNGEQIENGNYVHINIELQEIRRCWNRRMPNDTFSYQPSVNLERYEILLRYLASMGKNKDSLSVMQLSEQDLKNISKGIFNCEYPNWSFLHRRTYELVNDFYDFQNGGQINGHSLSMRPYFWKASCHAILINPLLGVGTGDLQDAMNKAYVSTDSPLNVEWYKHPHNQFLSITLALGVIGLIVFLVSLLYPTIILRKKLSRLFWVFFFLLLVSFLMEDTLETQAGLTFYVFFNSLFLWRAQGELEN